MYGASIFNVGFIVSSIGSDLPKIVNSVVSSFLGHGDISIGDSYGSVLAQISHVLGLIPFFYTFCRLIPSRVVLVGIEEVVILLFSIQLTYDRGVIGWMPCCSSSCGVCPS